MPMVPSGRIIKSQAKADVEATPTAIIGAADGQPEAKAKGPEGAELAGRLDTRRSVSATSEIMDATAGETAQLSKVIPRCIFAAGKQRFEVLVRGVYRVFDAKCEIFTDLPLEDNGWDFSATDVWAIRETPGGTIFGVARNNGAH